jgi:hypothetical protein
MNLPSYPKVWNIGHPSMSELFLDNVHVQEKVDGSQFSFGLDADGVLQFRSKGAEVYPQAAGMFTEGVREVQEVARLLTPGIIYRGEYLRKPKHNALAYSRVPHRHTILFDIHCVGTTETNLLREADRLGMEVVPTLFIGRVDNAQRLFDFLNTESVLGGVKIEGVVVKNYGRYHMQTGDPLFGKLVSEAFKEQHSTSWKQQNPTKADIIAGLTSALRCERRWEKACERLRDIGVLESDPRDIGRLIHSVQADVEEECAAEIKDALFKWAWPQIKRRVAAGLPEWYKRRLAESAFPAPESEGQE